MSVKTANKIFAAIQIEAIPLEFGLSEAEGNNLTIQYFFTIKKSGCYLIQIRFLRGPETNVIYRSNQ